MAHDDLVEAITDLTSVVKLAFADRIAEQLDQLREDPVTAAIMDAAGEWTTSKALQEESSKAADTSERTVRDRLATLASAGVLKARGSERKREYRTSEACR